VWLVSGGGWRDSGGGSGEGDMLPCML
jgi:hypothetical protein